MISPADRVLHSKPVTISSNALDILEFMFHPSPCHLSLFPTNSLCTVPIQADIIEVLLEWASLSCQSNGGVQGVVQGGVQGFML